MTARLLGVLILVLAASGTAAAKSRVGVGDAPPDYLGSTYEGHKVLLSDEPGKVTVISFWATWCPPCRQELPILEAMQRQAGKDRLRVIAIDVAEQKRGVRRSNKEIFEKYTLTFSFDLNGYIAHAFGFDAIPHMYILNKEGKVAFIHEGYDSNRLDGLSGELNQLLAEK